jgi:hypothetical protein
MMGNLVAEIFSIAVSWKKNLDIAGVIGTKIIIA